jgi:hypothetical protein
MSESKATLSQHQLSVEDPLELLWAAANTASEAIRAGDVLAGAVQSIIAADPADRETLIKRFLPIALQGYHDARHKRV